MGSAGRLEFGVLGPLEARRDGAPIRLGGARQRALLALLVLRANELVRVEELVDELFGAERSEVAANSVRVAVSRLRRLLGNGGTGGVLLTHAGATCCRWWRTKSTRRYSSGWWSKVIASCRRVRRRPRRGG